MNHLTNFSIPIQKDFNQTAIEVFRFQYENTLIYREFVDLLGVQIEEIQHYSQIPFLPISFFKTHLVFNKNLSPEHYFRSSGTGQNVQFSKHYFQSPDVYQKSFRSAFKQFIGDPRDALILGLLPNYQQNTHSSLIFMVDDLMRQSKFSESGYFLNNDQGLDAILQKYATQKIPIILFGVSFALLDFIKNRRIENSDLTVIETGGMKGRKTEMTKVEVLKELQNAFPNAKIASEYGMTELFSQAYALNSLYYKSPNWMKVMLRETEDPLAVFEHEGSGAINIIDLANINTCSFIATDDLGRINSEGDFEILGRMDHSEVRGCSQLVI